MRVTDEVENVRLNQTITEQHSLTIRAQSITPSVSALFTRLLYR